MKLFMALPKSQHIFKNQNSMEGCSLLLFCLFMAWIEKINSYLLFTYISFLSEHE